MPVKLKIGENQTGPVTKNRIQTTISLNNEAKKLASDSEFYELEPLEVLEVHLDDTKNSFPLKDGQPDHSFLGGIRGRFVLSEQGLNVDQCKDYKPLNSNINVTPVVGEIVIGVKYLSKYYYTSTLNVLGNPAHNPQFGLSKLNYKDTLVSKDDYETPNSDDSGTEMGYYFKKNEDARKILPHEGDVIFEGRFGNSIRIGSDIKNDNEDSPNIILNVGQSKDEFPNEKQPVEERIDTDGSSVYLTTNQKLEFTPAVESKVVTGPYEGKNILLSSDRIIFNSKNAGDIALFSSNNISVGAVKEVVVESPVVKVGSNDASEPQVLGNKLEEAINDIISILESGLICPTGNVTVVPGAGTLASLKVKLPGIKSAKHRIDK
tara:strand:- start:13930 stop:15060 length:1131 start_codon:yes stop_codon:yes gene_type:complete